MRTELTKMEPPCILGQITAIEKSQEYRLAIGSRLRALRQERSLSTRQLAKLTGIGQAHIVRIEAGKYNVGIDTIVKLASALGAKLEIVV